MKGRGGKREGAGRPPGSTTRKAPRNIVKQVRWTEEEWQEVFRAAKAAGIEPSAFIRRATLAACESP